MKYIQKQPQQPVCMTEFIQQQMRARPSEDDWQAFPVDYGHFTHTRELKEILLKEQGFICPYTGFPLDDKRLNLKQPRHQKPPKDKHWYTAHIEHLKPQAQCQAELVAQDKTPGKDPGEDLDYHNLIAAVLVSGSPSTEYFGAVCHRGDQRLPVLPTQADCEAKFIFDENGGISGRDAEANEVIDTLKLHHPTLNDLRMGAIEGFLPLLDENDQPLDEFATRAHFLDVIRVMEQMDYGKYEEFCFAIKSYAINQLETADES